MHRDGVSAGCDMGMHEWCTVMACECACHERPHAARSGVEGHSDTNTPPRRRSAGRRQRRGSVSDRGG